MKYNYDVAIIGGGAAGLVCARQLSNMAKKLNIVVIDAGERIGKKLAATGNGQGNVTNLNMGSDHYFSSNKELVEQLLQKSSTMIEQDIFHCLLTSDEVGRVYPGGRQASALVDSLLVDLKNNNVQLMLSTRVVELQKGFTLYLSTGNTITARFVVLACGGKAQKQFKTDGSSYQLAQKFGHTLTPLYPSLVQLKTDTAYTKTLKGIRVDALVKAYHKGHLIAEKRGDVIFTDYGVSGNVIFALSAFITHLSDVTLSICFLPDVSGQQIVEDIKAKKIIGYDKNEWLSGTLHNQVGRAIIKRAQTDNIEGIVALLKDFRLPVLGNTGFDYAQVTKGGIVLSEMTEELESCFVPNLFIAGEVLDVDGECGGYNLHWAFVSADNVAQVIAKRLL